MKPLSWPRLRGCVRVGSRTLTGVKLLGTVPGNARFQSRWLIPLLRVLRNYPPTKRICKPHVPVTIKKSVNT